MRRGRRALTGLVACVALVWAGAAMAAKPVDEAPGGAAGELLDALETCQDNLGASLDLGTCSNALAMCSGDLGTCTAALGTCPDDLTACTGNLSTCDGNLSTCQGDLAACEAALTPATCGDGVLDPGEACDGSTPTTCVELGFWGGELACAETCKLDTSGCSARFVDTGLTVVDQLTGLEWEKKTDDESIHDVDNEYSWSTAATPWLPNGTVFTEFLPALDGFNGSPACTDLPTCESDDGTTVWCSAPPPAGCWRLPEIDELQTIVDCTFGDPCIDPIFGPSASSFHWSATAVDYADDESWGVYFDFGGVDYNYKPIPNRVRAVRSSP